MRDSRTDSGDLNTLLDAVLALRSSDELRDFLADLCTMSELNAMAQRLHVAQLLRDKYTTQEIVKRTGCSTATISRVNRCMKYGTGGYDLVLNRAEEEKK